MRGRVEGKRGVCARSGAGAGLVLVLQAVSVSQLLLSWGHTLCLSVVLCRCREVLVRVCSPLSECVTVSQWLGTFPASGKRDPLAGCATTVASRVASEAESLTVVAMADIEARAVHSLTG
jgi:hypothetical protein